MPGETERSEVLRSRTRKLQSAPFGYRRARSLLSAVSWYDAEVAAFCYCDEKLARAPVRWNAPGGRIHPSVSPYIGIGSMLGVRAAEMVSLHAKVVRCLEAMTPLQREVGDCLGDVNGHVI